jgi:ATPase subunit of ABC transporter with duplicated ATPase domains
MLSLVTRASRSHRLWQAAGTHTWRYQEQAAVPQRCFAASNGAGGAQVVRAKNLTFGYDDRNTLLENVDFSIREGSKVTIMGQNGAGKSSIIKLLSNSLRPEEGEIIIRSGERVACAMQTMPMASREVTVKEFFREQLALEGKEDGTNTDIENHELEAKMSKALDAVVLDVQAPGDRLVKSFSGGQQARLLLAAALIRNPTVLLLDEPTNNLDDEGLWHLQSLIQETEKTCVVISHDEDFLNSFTDQVLYLNIHSKTVETYQGDYYFVKEEISKQIKRENNENALLMKKIQAKKDQAGKFANKGGGMRKVAKTMRGVAAEMETAIVDVRKEDIALRDFTLPFSRSSSTGPLLSLNKVSSFERVATMEIPVNLRKGSRVQVSGPNGIGKTTFLEKIVAGTAPGVVLADGATVGYYRQDFSNFDFDATVMTCLEEASDFKHAPEEIHRTAASFLLRGRRVMSQQVKTLSEGQKGLLSLACLHLQQPSILIMDEPTNHINFRHLPALAKAVQNFEGAVLLVSHDSYFVQDVGVDNVIDLGKELKRAQTVAA